MTALGDPPSERVAVKRPAAHASSPSPTPAPPHGDELGFDLPAPARASTTRIVGVALLALALLVAVFLVTWLPKRRAQRELTANAGASESTTLRVRVAAPKVKSSDRVLVLPGSVQPLEETIVYARASGYVRKWLVDIGDKVKEGDALVEIDTPELDQQLSQGRAQLVQAQAALGQATANREFSKTNLARYKDLANQGLASQQDLEQRVAQASVDEAAVKVAQAAIAAQQANVRRLDEMKSFARVTAPFGGTVNARMIERGALVSTTTQLFKISSVDPVRVFVQVPQDVATSVRPDVPAHVTVREYGGRVFEGRVARSAGALDAASRTMNTEVRVPNPKNELFAGMYAQVGLTLPSPHRVLEIPATALMNDSRGLRVAVVDADGRIKLVTVTVERDVGPTIELASGLKDDDRVVTLGGAELVEGRKVEIVP
ncbi:MAG: efflux RND transporter periplasmic adaptor subunit [Polyangiales bacterium]